MEIEAPYLKAIQAIAGNKPGEKQKTINSIARQIAGINNVISDSTSVDDKAEIPDVPEPLKPLVRVEVAKILHQYEGIIEGLKSEDITVVSRALQAEWFFDGSDKKFVNAEYFHENVFPEISLYARLKIIKKLGDHLKNTSVAADFFVLVNQLYGVSQATPLLIACEEDFAFEKIIENEIVLSLRMVETLFRKYPNLVVKYLKLCKPDNPNNRNLYRIDISAYRSFLPELGNKRFEDFMELYRMHNGLSVVLGKKGANTFIKTQRRLLVEYPQEYLRLVSLKTVTQKLSTNDFKKMFKNLLPRRMNDFNYTYSKNFLQFYGTEEEKLSLILNTFRDLYSKDLLSCKDLVHSDLIMVLPADERVKQARLKLEDDKDWHLYQPQESWRCYLPISMSIPFITKEIYKSSEADKRGQLLQQLIFTVKVNEDKDALLKILNHIYDRHKNDQKYIFYSCLSKIRESFDLAALNSTFWEIINKYIKFTEVQGDLIDEILIMKPLLEAAFHYCILNQLPMEDYTRMFVDMSIKVYCPGWNILTAYPDLEKKFLNLFIEVIPKQYPPDNEIWNDDRKSILYGLAVSLWDFNDRNKNSNLKPKKLSITDYPWLLESIKTYMFDNITGYYDTPKKFLILLRKNEQDFYHVFIRDLEKFWTYGCSILYDVLKDQPQRVLENWKECLETVQKTARRRGRESLFISKSRWYQHLPIYFFKESLKTYNDPKKCSEAISTLALLTDGETFTKIIEPFLPTDEKVDIDHPEAKDNYNILLIISSNLRKVNPPVTLDIIARFCIGDYLKMAMGSLTSVCCRVPVVKVIPFAKRLTERRVSVMKHGIRLMYLVAPLEEIYTYLKDLWNSQGHASIRFVLFTKIYDLFSKQPDSRCWRMLQMCLDNLNTDDDEKILQTLTELRRVPNEYLYEYIRSVLRAMKSMEKKTNDPKPYIDIACQIIKNIDGPITRILPEEYCQDLIKEYLFVFDYNPDIFAAGLNLTVDSYLLSSKEYNESRLKFFGEFFRHSVKEYWDKPHPECSKFFYPINFMVHKIFAKICNNEISERHDVRIFESLLEIFESALQPHQDFVAYLDLVYSLAYRKSQTSVDFAEEIVKKIPQLVEAFSPECVITMSNRLSGFVRRQTFDESENSEEKLLIIIEVFLNSGTIHCAFFAANMLFNNKSKKLNERYRTVINALRNYHHHGVSCYLNERLATFDICTDNNDELEI